MRRKITKLYLNCDQIPLNIKLHFRKNSNYATDYYKKSFKSKKLNIVLVWAGINYKKIELFCFFGGGAKIWLKTHS